MKLGKITQIFLYISFRRDNSRLSDSIMKRWGVIGSVFAQARGNLTQTRPKMKFWMLSGSILLKQENFHLANEQIFPQASKTIKSFIFYFESLVLYCLLFLRENSKFYFKK